MNSQKTHFLVILDPIWPQKSSKQDYPLTIAWVILTLSVAAISYKNQKILPVNF